MQNLVQALDAYKIKNGHYPTTAEGLAILQAGKVIKKVPLDTWGNPFEYVRHSANSFTIKSFGADGVVGGQGNQADIITEQ